jgi:hypothetical protein
LKFSRQFQPPNEDYESSYHRQLAQNQAMALAQLCVAKESSIPQNHLQMPYDDLTNNIDYAIEQVIYLFIITFFFLFILPLSFLSLNLNMYITT